MWMSMNNAFKVTAIGAALAAALAVSTPAIADVSYTGTIEVIEVWKQGNVAFRLSGITGTCANNNWMVVNKSAPGAKNMYAALVASKLAGKAIKVAAFGCAPAEEYGTTPYLVIDYLYMID
jgi:hypothetical protein